MLHQQLGICYSIQQVIVLKVVILLLIENVSGRMVSQYAGITTTMSALVADEVTQNLNSNPANFDINIGDYLEIDRRIMELRNYIYKQHFWSIKPNRCSSWTTWNQSFYSRTKCCYQEGKTSSR